MSVPTERGLAVPLAVFSPPQPLSLLHVVLLLSSGLGGSLRFSDSTFRWRHWALSWFSRRFHTLCVSLFSSACRTGCFELQTILRKAGFPFGRVSALHSLQPSEKWLSAEQGGTLFPCSETENPSPSPCSACHSMAHIKDELTSQGK